MNLLLTLNISISKEELSSLLDGKNLNLQTKSISDVSIKINDKENDKITLETKNIKDINKIKNDTDDIENISSPVSSIFSDKKKSFIRTAVEKIAAEEPPETQDIPFAIKTKEEIEEETPEEFIAVKDEKFKTFISNYEELMLAIHEAKDKSSNINIDEIKDSRKKLLALEQKELEESIDKDAFIVNEKCGSLVMNDLGGITLDLNKPFNLSRISAKRLIQSRDLRELIKNGTLKIIKPNEIDGYIKKISKNSDMYGLKTFSSKDDAEESLFSKSNNGIIDDENNEKEENNDLLLTEKELDEENEEEKLIKQLDIKENKVSQEDGLILSGNIRKTKHGNS